MALRGDLSSLTAKHPAHVFRPLPEMLDRWETDGIDTGVFHAGVEIAARRYTGYGLTKMLPLERVLIACESSRAGAFGGFHHPDQGYRHLQMASVITKYGPLERGLPEQPALALLDLLRAYAHDCLHYGSRRRYVEVAGLPVRTQYGINYRRTNGQCYSAADSDGSRHTRNLGVVMEGACDKEARSITRRAAEEFGITEPPGALGALAHRDMTGMMAEDEVVVVQGRGEQERYAAALIGYELAVNRRYASLLGEYAPGEEAELHVAFLRAVITGDVRELSGWLDDRHGPGTFTGLFRSPAYFV